MSRRPDGRAAFVKEARAQGVEIRKTLPDGRIVVAVEGNEATVSLENLSRNVARDGDVGAVKRFVATIRETLLPLPPWQEARGRIRYSAEAADHDFGDALRQEVTETVARVLVYVDADERRIRWLTPGDLADWKVNRDEAERAARENMAGLLSRTPIRVDSIGRHRLAMFDTESVFKASLIFSPNLKEVLRAKVGWPVYAVIPCRDFAYVFPVRDKDLIPRVGKVVVHEYRDSGYPITADVLEISDKGIRAIGGFPVE